MAKAWISALGVASLCLMTCLATAAEQAAPDKKAVAKKAIGKKSAPVSAKSAPVRRITPASNSRSGVTKSVTASAASKKGVTSKKGVASQKGGKRVVARRPPLQQQPTTDRYKEIQQALVDKGYFRGPADGTWNGESVDALKRFQKDQNLDPDGKIGALSLMALGLGPKRGTAGSSIPPSTDPVDPPPVALPQL